MAKTDDLSKQLETREIDPERLQAVINELHGDDAKAHWLATKLLRRNTGQEPNAPMGLLRAFVWGRCFERMQEQQHGEEN